MDIRPEQVSDYAAITALNIRAFGRLAESLVPTLHRQRRAFDPELSLVAEIDGQVVGHVLFTPHRLRLMGETIQAVNLSPIAVEPSKQKQGIGAALIVEGHRVARAKGYPMAFLLGHPTYYPRFGYQLGVYGWSSLGMWGVKGEPLVSRRLAEADLPALHTLWLAQESEVDFSIEPEAALADWISPNPAIRSLVFERDGEMVGYLRTHAMEPGKPRYLLARDAEAAKSMMALISGVGAMWDLPVHPATGWVRDLGDASAQAWDAGMACPLADSPYDEYAARVRAGERVAGRPIWGTAFDVE